MLRRVEILRQIGRFAVGEPGRLAVDGQIGLLLEVVGAGGVKRERAIESARAGQRGRAVAEVPLAAQVGAIAGGAQAAGDRDHVGAQLAAVARSTAMTKRRGHMQAGDIGQVRVHTGEQHRPRRRTHRRGMEVREAHAALGDRVDVGRANLATVRAQVREADVVRDHDDDVRPGGGRSPGLRRRRRGRLQDRGRHERRRQHSHAAPALPSSGDESASHALGPPQRRLIPEGRTTSRPARSSQPKGHRSHEHRPTRARNSPPPSSSAVTSGCHCTPMQNGCSESSSPSTTPSDAVATIWRPSPTLATPW